MDTIYEHHHVLLVGVVRVFSISAQTYRKSIQICGCYCH